MRTQSLVRFIRLFCIAAASALFIGAGNTQVSPVTPANPPLQPAPTNAPANRPHPLVWDSMDKTFKADFGATNAVFAFWVTNSGKVNVLISQVSPSCGCTVADYPRPWNLAPGASGKVSATMNIAGRTGTQIKELRVTSTGGPEQRLLMQVVIPDDPSAERRNANMAAAAKDRQAVFKTDCAACHVEPLKGLVGAQLFDKGCNICHAPEHGRRAAIVPDLHKLPIPMTKDSWKKMISDGKEGTLMPGFAKAHGGPLSDEEIDSLAQYAVDTFKFDPANAKKLP